MIEQGSTEWRQQRAGKITASRFVDAIDISKRTGKPTEARNKYARQLAFEIVSGQPIHDIKSLSLAWGSEAEALARVAYEMKTGNLVVQAEFATHPDYPFIGASADGLISSVGGIEIKSPHDEAVHVKTWLEGMPEDHMPQVQGNMMIHNRQWWDFVSYDPRQTGSLQLYVQRVHRDGEYIATMQAALVEFYKDVQTIVEQLKERAA